MKNFMSAAEYLAHRYELPKAFPEMPLADEEFISAWSSKENFDVLSLLSGRVEKVQQVNSVTTADGQKILAPLKCLQDFFYERVTKSTVKRIETESKIQIKI